MKTKNFIPVTREISFKYVFLNFFILSFAIIPVIENMYVAVEKA